ncbi:MAG: NAD-dependent epimerase/dehydratase family protein [Hyphomicrobiaceae bacterium]
MKVLVTGANGHLGYSIAAALLAAGHTVRGSIRSLQERHKAARVAALGPVELVAAELDDEGSLRAAMAGVDAVIHTAAVYRIYAPEGDAAILRAGIDGVAAAMRAAKDAAVSRVVLTSSVVALPPTVPGAPPVTEADWAEDLRVPYVCAKTLGERRAWELAAELGVDLVTVLPGACGGPGFQRPTPTIDAIASVMDGAFVIAAPPLNYPYVDVRDVARAHVLALGPNARGRYIAAMDCQPMVADIARIMHEIDRRVPAPKFVLPVWMTPALPAIDAFNARVFGLPRTVTPEVAGSMHGRVWNISSEKIRSELGWRPEISLRDSLADTMTVLRKLQADAA